MKGCVIWRLRLHVQVLSSWHPRRALWHTSTTIIIACTCRSRSTIFRQLCARKPSALHHKCFNARHQRHWLLRPWHPHRTCHHVSCRCKFTHLQRSACQFLLSPHLGLQSSQALALNIIILESASLALSCIRKAAIMVLCASFVTCAMLVKRRGGRSSRRAHSSSAVLRVSRRPIKLFVQSALYISNSVTLLLARLKNVYASLSWIALICSLGLLVGAERDLSIGVKYTGSQVRIINFVMRCHR